MESLERGPESLENHMERAPKFPMPKVTLHFIRHSIKEKTSKDVPDKDIHISEEGRIRAADKFDAPMNLRFGHVVGSPRVRTIETAAVVATQNPDTNPDDLGVGKVRTTDDLDFVARETSYGKAFNQSYDDGRVMSFVVNESDKLAKETGDEESSTYSRMAARVAGIIYDNVETAIRGAEILAQSSNPKNAPNNFERILATHATVQESFLLKVVEKVQGYKERDALLALIGENGFDFVEGFDVLLSKEGDEEKIRITFKKGDYVFDELISKELLKEIADGGNE